MNTRRIRHAATAALVVVVLSLASFYAYVVWQIWSSDFLAFPAGKGPVWLLGEALEAFLRDPSTGFAVVTSPVFVVMVTAWTVAAVLVYGVWIDDQSREEVVA